MLCKCKAYLRVNLTSPLIWWTAPLNIPIRKLLAGIHWFQMAYKIPYYLDRTHFEYTVSFYADAAHFEEDASRWETHYKTNIRWL